MLSDGTLREVFVTHTSQATVPTDSMSKLHTVEKTTTTTKNIG